MPLVLGEPIANVLNLEAERLLFSSCQKLSASTGGTLRHRQLPHCHPCRASMRRGPGLRLQKAAGPSGLVGEDCSLQACFHGSVQSNLWCLWRGDFAVSISRSPATCNHSQPLAVGPAHADMALNSQSTEGARAGREDYIF